MGMQESELTVGIPSKLIRDLVEGLRVSEELCMETRKRLRVMNRRIQRKERFCILLDQIQIFFPDRSSVESAFTKSSSRRVAIAEESPGSHAKESLQRCP